MAKFEYKVYAPDMKRGLLKKSFSLEDLEAQLKELGWQNWELVSTIPISGNTGISYGAATAQVLFIFKREVL